MQPYFMKIRKDLNKWVMDLIKMKQAKEQNINPNNDHKNSHQVNSWVQILTPLRVFLVLLVHNVQ